MIAPQIVLECDSVSHNYGSRRVLNQVNLRIAAGQIVALVGPSGCGKSTLLRAILGTDPPAQGEVRIDGRPMLEPNRHVGIVYQHYSLFDYLNALDNVVFGLMLERTKLSFRLWQYPRWLQLRRQYRAEAMAMLEKVKLADAAHLYPSQMSGGMRQRVAIAQTLVMRPRIILLDEPFGALDESTRESLQLMLLELYAENLAHLSEGSHPPYTIILVTHELNEALYVADRVVGLSQFHQTGREGATIVYDKPAPVFRPEDARDMELLTEQREEIRRAVFDPSSVRHHSEFVTFWPPSGPPWLLRPTLSPPLSPTLALSPALARGLPDTPHHLGRPILPLPLRDGWSAAAAPSLLRNSLQPFVLRSPNLSDPSLFRRSPYVP